MCRNMGCDRYLADAALLTRGCVQEQSCKLLRAGPQKQRALGAVQQD